MVDLCLYSTEPYCQWIPPLGVRVLLFNYDELRIKFAKTNLKYIKITIFYCLLKGSQIKYFQKYLNHWFVHPTLVNTYNNNKISSWHKKVKTLIYIVIITSLCPEMMQICYAEAAALRVFETINKNIYFDIWIIILCVQTICILPVLLFAIKYVNIIFMQVRKMWGQFRTSIY